MSKNNDYTTGNFMNYEYFSKHYRLIAIDLNKKIELENPDLKRKKRRNHFCFFTKLCNCLLICIKMETQIL